MLIIDEGLSVGDGHFQQKCLDRIESFRSAGKTMLIVSHDMDTIGNPVHGRFGSGVALSCETAPLDVLQEYEAVIDQEMLSIERESSHPL